MFTTLNAKRLCRGLLPAIVAAILLHSAPGLAQTQPCAVTNGIKFILLPQTLGGFDVFDGQGVVLADDFLCTSTGPITDIHIWTSWLNNQVGTVTNFWLGIYNDVPAVTNLASGQITPSHPGTNLLWSQFFDQSQFSETLYTANADEYFADPRSETILGGDSEVFFYCFYPTNAFVQQGTAAQPTNYWLAVNAAVANPTNLFGWKTCISNYNDAAVWIPAIGQMPAIGPPWTPIYSPLNTNQALGFSFILTTPTNSPPPTLCVETDQVKYVQGPDLNEGFDVWNSSTKPPGIADGPWVLADDFICTNTGPITDIHLWGSWFNDLPLTNNITFWLGVYDDVPVNSTNTYSHPGNLLWQQYFAPGQYAEEFYTDGQEHFLDPAPPAILGPESQVWYYCFYPSNLTQTGTVTSARTYWLAAFATLPAGTPYVYGWKTTTNVQNDISVHAPWPGLGPTNNPGWVPTYQSSGPAPAPLDLAFKIDTTTNAPPPTSCVETDAVKYVQGPNVFGGLDVWNSSAKPPGITDGPWVLADDFVCTNTGPISDIHIWGSWLFDYALPNNITFWLAIYSNVPANPPVTNYSQPGTLLWSQSFTPGQYAELIYTNGQEQFFDPGQSNVIGADSLVWYYCFYPTNLVQYGSVTNPTIYWLSVFAQLPAGVTNIFGWKTTTNVQFDISVHAPWPGFVPPNNPGWTPTFERLPTGGLQPLDLAFKISTVTNRCPIPVACAIDKQVECGSSWSFDPPTVGPDPCCSSPPTVTLVSVITNSTAQCHQVYTAIWNITDCDGQMVTCTQQVTVVDTTPPVITCSSNKTVECGSVWSFDPPTATDACCGTNVTISILNTVTNGSGCPSIITRTWVAADCCTNTNTCSQTVTVVDTTPPSLTVPTNFIVYTCSTNIVVTWSVTATDVCSSVTVTSSPPSPATFLPDTTNTVSVTAHDACGNTTNKTFMVTVDRPVLGSLMIHYLATNMVVLTWSNGILEMSTNVLGPYSDVSGATSPYTNATSLPTKFYRLRCLTP